MATFLDNEVFEAKFPLLDVIGSETANKVYTTHHNHVVKVICLENNITIQAGLIEIDSLQRLQHPNVCTLTAWTYRINNKKVCFKLALPRGQSIKTVISQITFDQVLGDILSALIYFDQVNFCHNDLKVENLIFHDNQVKIIDFGLVSPVASIDSKRCILSPAFTLNYRDPEIVLGSGYKILHQNLNLQLYAVAVILLKLFGQVDVDNVMTYPVNATTEYPNLTPREQEIIKCLVSFPANKRMDPKSIIERFGLTFKPGNITLPSEILPVITDVNIISVTDDILTLCQAKYNRTETLFLAVTTYYRLRSRVLSPAISNNLIIIASVILSQLVMYDFTSDLQYLAKNLNLTIDQILTLILTTMSQLDGRIYCLTSWNQSYNFATIINGWGQLLTHPIIPSPTKLSTHDNCMMLCTDFYNLWYKYINDVIYTTDTVVQQLMSSRLNGSKYNYTFGLHKPVSKPFDRVEWHDKITLWLTKYPNVTVEANKYTYLPSFVYTKPITFKQFIELLEHLNTMFLTEVDNIKLFEISYQLVNTIVTNFDLIDHLTSKDWYSVEYELEKTVIGRRMITFIKGHSQMKIDNCS